MIKKIIAIFVIVSYVFVDLLYASPLPRASEATLASAMLPISAQEFLTSPLMLPKAKASSDVSLMPMKRVVKSFLGAQAVPILLVSTVFIISITKLPLAAAFGLSIAAGALWVILKWQDFRHAALALLFVAFFWMPVKPEKITYSVGYQQAYGKENYDDYATSTPTPRPKTGDEGPSLKTHWPIIIFFAVIILGGWLLSRREKRERDKWHGYVIPIFFLLMGSGQVAYGDKLGGKDFLANRGVNKKRPVQDTACLVVFPLMVRQDLLIYDAA